MRTCDQKIMGWHSLYFIPHIPVCQKILSSQPSKEALILNILTTATAVIQIGVTVISCLVYSASLPNGLLLPSLPFQCILHRAVWNTFVKCVSLHIIILFKTTVAFILLFPEWKILQKSLSMTHKDLRDLSPVVSLLPSLFRPFLTDIFSLPL